MDKFSLTEFLIGQAASFVLGLITSLLSWWALVHWIAPKVGFSTFISTALENGRHVYRVRIYNEGRRDIVDAYVMVILRVRGLRKPGIWSSFRVPLDWTGASTITVPVIRPRTNRSYRLHFEVFPELAETLYVPAAIRKKLLEKRFRIEDLAPHGTVQLIVYVGGSDRWTASRKVFESAPYTIEDIKEEAFPKRFGKRLGVLARLRSILRPTAAAEKVPEALPETTKQRRKSPAARPKVHRGRGSTLPRPRV